jgi:Na+-transporting NADH:ubiquinone oxidoreductase subunit F
MQIFKATFEDRFEFNERFVKLSFELKKPFRIDFQAGQYLKFKISEQLEQEYFFFSAPEIDHGFEILIDNSISGPSTDYFKSLSPGDIVEISAPYGEFTVGEGDGELILIGTEVGIAPLYSIVLDLLQSAHSSRKISLYWGLDKLEDFFLYDEMSLLTKNFPNFNFHPVIGKALPEWTLCRGSVYDCLSVHQVNADALFYICANVEMSDKIKNLCLANEVLSENITITNYS